MDAEGKDPQMTMRSVGYGVPSSILYTIFAAKDNLTDSIEYMPLAKVSSCYDDDLNSVSLHVAQRNYGMPVSYP
jgi:hypothetical protein